MLRSRSLLVVSRSAAGAGTITVPLEIGELRAIRAIHNVSAISGVGATSTFLVSGRLINGTAYDLYAPAGRTAVGTDQSLIEFPPTDMRISITITGTTPSVTFRVEIVSTWDEP